MVFKDTMRLAAYGTRLSEADHVAFIVTSKAMDNFCKRAILPDICMPEKEYRALMAEAFKICEGIRLD